MVAALYVFLGGGLGAVLRYASIVFVGRYFPAPFPFATLGVNVIGSFIMGMLMAWVLREAADREALRLLLAVGVLGGFTTFSAFSWDVLVMWQRADIIAALLYIAGSLLLSLIAVSIGFIAMHKGGVV